MTSLQFTLFTLEAYPRTSLFVDSPPSGSDVLIAAIRERPTGIVRKDIDWRIANVDEIAPRVLLFKIGKVGDAPAGAIDDETGDFVNVMTEAAIATWAVYDANSATVAIASNTQVTQDVVTVARYLRKLLERSNAVKDSEVDIRINLRRETITLIQQLRVAKSIQKISVTFGRRNPPNASKGVEAWKQALEALDATRGSAVAQGDHLDREETIDMVQEAGERGEGATVTFVPEKKRVPIRRSIGEVSRAVVPFEATDGLEDPESRRELASRISEQSRGSITNRQLDGSDS